MCEKTGILTQLSQLPATNKLVGMAAGLKANAEVESSGGETTSKSFIGFTVAVVVVLENVVVPRPLWGNIAPEISVIPMRNTTVGWPLSDTERGRYFPVKFV